MGATIVPMREVARPGMRKRKMSETEIRDFSPQMIENEMTTEVKVARVRDQNLTSLASENSEQSEESKKKMIPMDSIPFHDLNLSETIKIEGSVTLLSSQNQSEYVKEEIQFE